MFWSAKLVSNVFISCSYYREAEQRVLTKISIAVISEPSDHSLIVSFNWTNVIVNELKMRMKNSSKKVILWSDGCSLQFCTKYVFALMTNLDKSVQSEWHFNEVNHWKDPGDCVSGTIKRVVFRFGAIKQNHYIYSGRICNGGFKDCAVHSINLHFRRWWDNRASFCECYSIHSGNSWY